MNQTVFYDTETTGIDPYGDRIIEFAFMTDDGSFSARVNPGVPIPAEATAVHGITDADVAGCPSFAHYAPTIQTIVDGATLCGYACRRFDTILLHEELVRAGQPGLQVDKAGRIVTREIDLLELWLRHEDRKLTTAAKRFAATDLGDAAHSAYADTGVLSAVLDGMCAAFGLERDDLEQLASLSVPEGAVDRDGKFLKRDDGVIVFNFGKAKGQPAHLDVGLLDWTIRQPFITAETKAVAEIIRRRALKATV